MKYEITFGKQAIKDLEKISKSPLHKKMKRLLEIIEENPLQPPFEKLIDLENTYSRRINVQHRLVYRIYEEEKTIKIMRCWTHYGDN